MDERHIIIEKLKLLWDKYPDQRLGQLCENYIFDRGERGDGTSIAMFFQSDDMTEKKLDKVLE